jgi:excisionase family DNA binding protein
VGAGRTGPYEHRLTVSQAADQLGVSTEAIRGRIRRGTIRYERIGGRVYVVLDERPTAEHTADQTPGFARTHTEELIATLREQLDLERQAHAEARRLLAAALERIPAIEAPKEPSQGSPETAESPGPRERPFTHEEGAQEAAQPPGTPRSWWRRMCSGGR